jgi:hypothetical protein
MIRTLRFARTSIQHLRPDNAGKYFTNNSKYFVTRIDSYSSSRVWRAVEYPCVVAREPLNVVLKLMVQKK